MAMDDSTHPHLTPALSAPRGGEGEKAGAAHVPSPPFRGERDRERWVSLAPRRAFLARRDVPPVDGRSRSHHSN